MDWEVKDFRKKPPTPGWFEWRVPKELGFDYILKIFLFLYAIPFLLFGAVFTPFGMLINVVIIDYFIYLGYKSKGLL